MGPIVAVEVAPAPTTDKAALSALLSSCSQALPSGVCQLGSATDSGELAARAQVTWDDRGNAYVVVELEGGERQLIRDLVFAEQDPRRQRFRTAGLTIATMVDELRIQREATATAPAPSPAPEPPTPSPEPPKPAPEAEPKPPSARPPSRVEAPSHPNPKNKDLRHPVESPRDLSSNAIEAGALFGLAPNGATPRGGLYASALHDMSRLPALALVRAAYQLSSTDEPSLSWLELGLGGGAYFPVAGARIETLGALQVTRVQASARSPTSGASDAAASWLPGAAGFVRLVWPASGAISGSIGLDGEWTARSVAVTNAGKAVARVPAYTVGLVGAIRFVL